MSNPSTIIHDLLMHTLKRTDRALAEMENGQDKALTEEFKDYLEVTLDEVKKLKEIRAL